MPSPDTLRAEAMKLANQPNVIKLDSLAKTVETYAVEQAQKRQIVQNVQSEAEPDTAALSQEDVDRYQFLSSAFSGVDIPLEIQLAAYENHGEYPSGINLNQEILGGMDLIDWLKEVVSIQTRKAKYGVQKGVDDPEDRIKEKQRAVVIYTRCALEIAEAEAIAEAAEDELRSDPNLPQEILDELNDQTKVVSRMVHFPAPDGASLGKNGYIHLFPGYPDSPAGIFRGDGAAFKAQECVDFIGKHFPEIEDEFINALADA